MQYVSHRTSSTVKPGKFSHMQLVCPCWGWLSTRGLRILPTCGWKFLEGAPLNLYQKGEAGVYYEELTTWEGIFPKVAKPGGWVGSPKRKQRGYTKVSVPQGLRRSGCRLRGPPGNTAKPFRFRSCFSPWCVAYIHTHTYILFNLWDFYHKGKGTGRQEGRKRRRFWLIGDPV